MTLVVTVDGMPANVRIKNSLSDDFDKAAVDPVRQWKFTPATKGGRPVPVMIAVEVKFHLY